MNLFLIVKWDENFKYIYILCHAYAIYGLTLITGIKVWVYAFFNLEIYTVYIKMFKLVFKVLGDAAWSLIQFVYIYRTGLRMATVDIYKK